MSPSEGSLSDTSSMRACDIVAVVLGGGMRSRRGEDGGVFEFGLKLGFEAST